MKEILITPRPINKENFSKFGDIITTKDIKPIDINNGYAKRHPLGSQAFIPMKETTFLCFVAPEGQKPDLKKIESFIITPGIGINYKPGIWHFPLISTEDMNFLVVDRKGSGENLVIENLEENNITLKY